MQIFNSFSENIKEKSKNPFFGTLICVWLVRNWELVYTLFNFDSDCQLADKVQFVRDYYSSKTFWSELLINVGIAFGLMLIGFFLLIVTKVLSNIVDQRIIPSLNEKTVKGLTVKRVLYEQIKGHALDLQNNLDMVSTKLIDIEVVNSQLKSEKNKLELESIELNTNLNNLSSELKNLNKSNELLSSIKISHEKQIAERDLIVSQLTDREIIREYLQREGRTKNVGIPKIIRAYRELENKGLKAGFLNLADCMSGNELITKLDAEEYRTLSEMDLIYLKDPNKDLTFGVRSNELVFENLGFSIYNNLDLLKKTEI